MYKLVAIDVDGTLVNDDKKLTQKTINSIKNAIQRDIKIVISSARSFNRLKNYLEQLDLMKDKQYTICFNGAVIIENKNQNVLLSNNFKVDDIWELINIANKFDTPIFLYSMNNVFAEEVPKIIQNSKNFKNIKLDLVKFETIDYNENIIYKIIFVNNYDNIAKIRKQIPKELYEKFEITSSMPERIEFVKKGITKSNSLQFICKECNIKRSEVIAIGDADNDIDMINFAGLGVAMGNAQNLLKEKANYITRSNNDDGVADVIEKYILSIKQ